MASIDSGNEEKTRLVAETKETESEETEPTKLDESLKRAINNDNEPNNETSQLTSDDISSEGRIYSRSKRMLKIEMCLRIESLICKKHMKLSDLNQPELVETLQFVEKHNIEIFDRFVAEPDSYDTEGQLNLYKFVRSLQSIRNINDIKSPEATGSRQRVMSGPQTPPPMTPEQEVAYEFDRLGYKFVNLNDERRVTLRITGFDKKKLRLQDDEVIEFPDPKDCYGVKLSRTRFGKTCKVSNLPNNEEDFFELELFSLFAQHGRVLEMKIKYSKGTHRPSGNAYVTFSTRQAVRSAIKNLRNYQFRPNEPLVIDECWQENMIRMMLVNVLIDVSVENIKTMLSQKFDGLRKIEKKLGEKGPILFVDFIDNEHAKKCYDYFKEDSKALSSENVTARWRSPRGKLMLVYYENAKMTEANMQKIFAKFGSIVSFESEFDCAYVNLEFNVDHVLACDELHNKTIDGSVLKCYMLGQSKKQKDKARQTQQNEPKMCENLENFANFMNSSLFDEFKPDVSCLISETTTAAASASSSRLPLGNLTNQYNKKLDQNTTMAAIAISDKNKTKPYENNENKLDCKENVELSDRVNLKRELIDLEPKNGSFFKRFRSELSSTSSKNV